MNANRTVTVKDADGEIVAAVDFHHDCFPELSDYIPPRVVGNALDKAGGSSLEVGKTYSITVTAK